MPSDGHHGLFAPAFGAFVGQLLVPFEHRRVMGLKADDPPGQFHQQAADARIAVFGDRTLTAMAAAGVDRGAHAREAGHLAQRGLVDIMIVGADRVTARGDAANKIGTYLKALAARAHDIPFYVALPVSTIDWTIEDGIRQIPIEQRGGREVTHLWGISEDGRRQEVLIAPQGTVARNDAFDVTPGGLITGLVTQHGVFEACAEGLGRLALALGRP